MPKADPSSGHTQSNTYRASRRPVIRARSRPNCSSRRLLLPPILACVFIIVFSAYLHYTDYHGANGMREVVAAAMETLANCKDENPQCLFWQNQGDCQKNSAYMTKHCQKSCGRWYDTYIYPIQIPNGFDPLKRGSVMRSHIDLSNIVALQPPVVERKSTKL